MTAGEVWIDRKTGSSQVRLTEEQSARRDQIVARFSRNRQGRRAAQRALRKQGLR